MSGFPVRPTRAAFGPKPQNRRPTRNPSREMDADVGDLLFWQTSALGLLVPVAWVLCTPDDLGDLEITQHAEAWNPNGTLPGPDLEQMGTGVYNLSFATEYADKDGQMRPTNLIWGLGAPLAIASNGSSLSVTVQRLDAATMEARVQRTSGSAYEDKAFAMLIW